MNWTLYSLWRRALTMSAAATTLLPCAPVRALPQSATQAAPPSAQSTPSTYPSQQAAKLGTATAQPPLQQVPQLTPEQLGDTLSARQRYQAAIDAYKKAPQDSAVVWNKMGIAYQMMSDLADASRCYQASLKIDPHNASVLNNLGTTYDSLMEYSDAERMYRRALKIDPRSAVILKNLGTSQMAEHKYKLGWQSYQAAMAISPEIFEDRLGPTVDNPSTAQNRGAMNFYMAKACVRAGMNDRAIEYLRRALNEGFTNPKKIIADQGFAALHGIPAFEQMLAAQGPQ